MDFYLQGFEVERFPAVAEGGGVSSGGESHPLPMHEPQKPRREKCHPGLFATTLSLRLALREAERRRAETVLILEDDVAFASEFLAVFDQLEFPTDWGLMLLVVGIAHRVCRYLMRWCAARRRWILMPGEYDESISARCGKFWGRNGIGKWCTDVGSQVCLTKSKRRCRLTPQHQI